MSGDGGRRFSGSQRRSDDPGSGFFHPGSLKLADTFIADLNQDIDDFETAIKGKGTGKGKKAGATTGIGKTIHDAGIALHVLNTIVPNTYANDPQKLAEWVIASHVEKHTPVPRAATLAKKAAAKAAKNKPATP